MKSTISVTILGHISQRVTMGRMGRKKVSTTVYLTEEQVTQLKELHRRTRVPIAEYIRMGIDLMLERHSGALPGQVSLFGDVPREELGTDEHRDQRREQLARQTAPATGKVPKSG